MALYYDDIKKKKRRKYGNNKVTVCGIAFDSKKESDRWLILQDMQRRGQISELKLQPKFDIIVNDIKVCTWTGDFEYINNQGERIVEDVKSPATKKDKTYRLKNKLIKAIYDIDILET